MGLTLGLDIGSVSIKLAALGEPSDGSLFKEIARQKGSFVAFGDGYSPGVAAQSLLVSRYRRIKGQPIQAARELLKEILEFIPQEKIGGLRITGSGGRVVADILGAKEENEFKAIALGTGFLYPEVRTIFEMGGVCSKYIRLEPNEDTGALEIVDYETNGDCAAGTGSFIDQQASRLLYKIEEVGEVVKTAEKAAKIAGRCSVFAKSDMIHAQQKGYTPPEVLKGLCDAVARNFKGAVIKNKIVVPPVAFVGGVAANSGVVAALEDAFGLEKESLFIPPYFAWLGAIGAALLEKKEVEQKKGGHFSLREGVEGLEARFPTSDPLSMEKVILLRDRVKPYSFAGKKLPVKAYLGIDVGSVSTNLAVIDEEGEVIMDIYVKTEARPIEVVHRELQRIQKEIGDKIEICGVATTGSGRELIGKLVGADTINDEITSHKTGASFIGEKMLDLQVDTIFEVGGQDSKFISLQDGIVVDFTMNEACAAGTGSFLEERSEELEVNIIGEFAKRALGSPSPIKLGERCTVFMEMDVTSYQQRGAEKDELIAGLAYSVVYNYLNRVVRERKIGNVIFFQGGTAYNDSVAAAFSKVLDKKIIVPPYNGILGAIGVALLVKEKMALTGEKTKFRGYDLHQIDYLLKEFICKACTNYCNIQMFKVEGERTYWGDKCSEMFRKRAVVETKPVIPDLLSIRDQLLFEGYDPDKGDGPRIGIPRCMYFFDDFPFWNTFFQELDFRVYLSEVTTRKAVNDGLDTMVAEPCFPLQVAHGHVKNLLEAGVDYIFIPNQINAESKSKKVESYVCNWGQTLPFVVVNAPAFEPHRDKFIIPTLRFREGRKFIFQEMLKWMKRFGLKGSAVRAALDKAYEAKYTFARRLLEMGREALAKLESDGRRGIVLVGRPYNINDKGLNLDVGGKLRDYYGVNVIPMDFLPIEGIDIDDINDNMYWNYGCKILATAKFIQDLPYLHIIYITNFKCGPDSYVKHYVVDASQRPFLSLQFDCHSNDAGILTRCEAYLDSKGILRWWREKWE